jgi:hypothetical protein
MPLSLSALGERKLSTGRPHFMKKFYFVGGPKTHAMRNERNAKPSHFIVSSIRLFRRTSATTSKQLQSA